MIRCQELTPESFAPFGQVITTPIAPGRDYFSEALTNAGPQARPSLSLAYRAPSPLPLVIWVLGRGRLWSPAAST
jgi:ureidoglycolate lyase